MHGRGYYKRTVTTDGRSTPLRLGIDLRILDTPGAERTGLGRYALEITRGLLAARPEWEFVLYSNRGDLVEPGPNRTVVSTRWPTHTSVGRIAWLHAGALASVVTHKPDVWFGPTFVLPFWWRGPAIVMVQDLIFMVMPDAYKGRLNALYATVATRSAVHRATRVIVPSSETAAQLRVNVPGNEAKTQRIPNGVSAAFFRTPAGANGRTEVPYFLFVGTFEARKGIDTLFAAAQQLKELGHRFRVRMAGRAGWKTDALVDQMRESGFVDVVIEPTDDELSELYAKAAAVVYPSRKEGFGLPVAEGLASGVPVVTSDLECIREFALDAPIYVPPGDASALVEALRELIDTPGQFEVNIQRGLQVASQLTWHAVAAQTAAVIDEVRAYA